METKKASNYDRKLFSMKHYKSISPQEIKEGFAKYFMPTPTAASLASIEENKGCSEVGYPDPEDEDDMNDVDEFEKKGDAPMISPKIFRGLKTKFRLDSPQCTAPELHPIPLSKFHWNNAIVNLSCIYKYQKTSHSRHSSDNVVQAKEECAGIALGLINKNKPGLQAAGLPLGLINKKNHGLQTPSEEVSNNTIGNKKKYYTKKTDPLLTEPLEEKIPIKPGFNFNKFLIKKYEKDKKPEMPIMIYHSDPIEK